MRVGGSKFSLSSFIKTILAFLGMIGIYIFLQNIVFLPRKLGQENEEENSKESNSKTALQKRKTPALISQELNSAGLNPVEEFLTQSYEKRVLTESLDSTLIEGTKIGVLNGTFSEVSNIVIKGDYAFYGHQLIKISDGSHPFIVKIYDTGITTSPVQLSLTDDQNHLLVTNDVLCIYNLSVVTNPTRVQSPCYQTTPSIYPMQAESVNSKVYLISQDKVFDPLFPNLFEVPNLFDVMDLSAPKKSQLGLIQYISGGRLIDMAGAGDNLHLIDTSLGYAIFGSRQPIISHYNVVTGDLNNLDVNPNYLYAAGNLGLFIFDKITLQLKGLYSINNPYDLSVVGTIAHLAAGPSGYLIIDTINPSNSRLLGVYADPYVYHVKVFGNYTYLLDSKGLQILDNTNRPAPSLVTTYSRFPSLVSKWVFLDGFICMLHFDGTLETVALTNNTHLSYRDSLHSLGVDMSSENNFVYIVNAGGLSIYGLYHGELKLIRTYFVPNPTSVSVVKGIAYVGYPYGVKLIDVSNPLIPTFLCDYAQYFLNTARPTRVRVFNNMTYIIEYSPDTPSYNYIFNFNAQLWTSRLPMTTLPSLLTVSDNFSYVLDSNNILHTINVTNALEPREISLYALEPTVQINDMTKSGDFLYLARQNATVVVLDVSNPLLPQLAGNINVSAVSLAVQNNEFLYAITADPIVNSSIYSQSLYNYGLTIFNIPEKLFLVNNQLSLSKGQTVPVRVEDIAARDTRQQGFYSEITFLVSNQSNGEFIFNNSQTTLQFTQQNIIDGLIKYKHNGGLIAPSYSLTAFLGNISTNLMPASISFTKTYQTPNIRENSFSVVLNGVVTLSANNINASVDNGDYLTIQYIVDNIGNGRFQSIKNKGVILTTFSQQQINRNEIQFVHFGNATEIPFYQLSGGDGPNSTEFVNGTTTLIVPKPPTFSNNQIVINQGQTLTLTPNNIAAVSSNVNDPSLIKYTVNKIGNSRFQNKDNPGILITEFRQDQINNGTIQYVHLGNGTEIPSYEISVSDGISTPFNNGTIDFIIHQPPQLLNHQFPVNQGQITTLTSKYLSATSNVDINSWLYTVNNIGNGRFQIKINPGIAITQFTEAQKNMGLIEFEQLGNGLSRPSAQVSVSDGQSAIPFIDFIIDFNAAPIILINQLIIGNGETRAMTSKDFLAIDYDSNNDTLEVTLSNFSHVNVSINPFLQQQLTNGEVLISHDGSGIRPSYLASVSDGNASITNQAPTITFTNTNNNTASTNTTPIIGATVGGFVGAAALLIGAGLFAKHKYDQATRNKHRLAKYIWKELDLEGINNFENGLGKLYVSVIENKLIPELKEHDKYQDIMQVSDLKQLAKDIATIEKNRLSHGKIKIDDLIEDLDKNVSTIVSEVLKRNFLESEDNYYRLEEDAHGDDSHIPLKSMEHQPYMPTLRSSFSGFQNV
jgi:hypothetical protein